MAKNTLHDHNVSKVIFGTWEFKVYLPEGVLGTKSTVLVLALRFSPLPSIQTYMHWVFFEAVMSSFRKLNQTD